MRTGNSGMEQKRKNVVFTYVMEKQDFISACMCIFSTSIDTIDKIYWDFWKEFMRIINETVEKTRKMNQIHMCVPIERLDDIIENVDCHMRSTFSKKFTSFKHCKAVSKSDPGYTLTELVKKHTNGSFVFDDEFNVHFYRH